MKKGIAIKEALQIYFNALVFQHVRPECYITIHRKLFCNLSSLELPKETQKNFYALFFHFNFFPLIVSFHFMLFRFDPI